MIQQAAFDKLTAMGIELYQLREQQSNEAANSYLTLDESTITGNRLYLDVLAALSLNQTEVTISPNTIDLGLFCWHFHDENSVKLEQQNLQTPTLEALAEQPHLKQQLWQLLTN
ncbi:hypothetical protein DXX93_17180 [Thalassotalea euphylliae]|uniref:DNA polymerase III subunit psi n=1 Tax=Thalassotalea euphylliae TaxID=1655234 RepID=A0A3E0TVX9_9GAMM|nr:DNA polymerase III subunit psi [Thalassotalea euphylliae]REL28125.1 hypothetical protein DXX93_17180 [Thalassotalea euphylliae]